MRGTVTGLVEAGARWRCQDRGIAGLALGLGHGAEAWSPGAAVHDARTVPSRTEQQNQTVQVPVLMGKSTSGQQPASAGAQSSAQRPWAPWAGQSRPVSTLARTGIPKPRPEVEDALSTARGGHLGRLIAFSETIADLDHVLQEHAESLGAPHMAAAARQLERLYRQDRVHSSSLKLKLIAQHIEAYAAETAPQLATMHIAAIVRGLTGAGHSMQQQVLLSLAAALTAKDCARLRLASELEWKDIVWGFSMQDFENTVFWHRLCGAAVPRLGSWDPNRVASVFKNSSIARAQHASFAEAATALLADTAPQLEPQSIADSLYAIATVRQQGILGAGINSPQDSASSSSGHGSGATAKAVAALVQQGLAKVGQFDGKTLALFVSEAARLKAGSQELASKTASAAQALPKGSLKPVYMHKLVSACVSMGLDNPAFYAAMAKQTSALLPTAPAPLRDRLVACLTSAPGAAALPEVAALVKKQQGKVAGAKAAAMEGKPKPAAAKAAV